MQDMQQISGESDRQWAERIVRQIKLGLLQKARQQK